MDKLAERQAEEDVMTIVKNLSERLKTPDNFSHPVGANAELEKLAEVIESGFNVSRGILAGIMNSSTKVYMNGIQACLNDAQDKTLHDRRIETAKGYLQEFAVHLDNIIGYMK